MNNRPERIRIGERVSISVRGKKKTYVADYWQAGQHCRQSLKTTNQKVARMRAVELETKLARGEEPNTTQRVDISEAIIAYLYFVQTEGRRPKTYKKYLSYLEVFAHFARDHNVQRLDQLQPLLIDQFRAVRKLTHSPKSMHNEAVMLKGFLNWCESRGLAKTNAMAAMTFKRPPLVSHGGPTLEHIDQILESAAEPRRTQLAVLAFTGMRVGELQRLRREDLDLVGNWLHIVSREGHETKTGHSRKVPIHLRLRPHLVSLPSSRHEWLFTERGSKKYPDGGHWLNTKRLNADLSDLLKGLGIPSGRHGGNTVHSLRHSFKTICVNARIPERAVDIWLGHQTGSSVRALYYLLSDEESQRFMNEVPFGPSLPAAESGV